MPFAHAAHLSAGNVLSGDESSDDSDEEKISESAASASFAASFASSSAAAGTSSGTNVPGAHGSHANRPDASSTPAGADPDSGSDSDCDSGRK